MRMFEHLTAYSQIVVVGPFRSGTCFTTKCIAHDTGHEFIPERAHGLANYEKMVELMQATHHVVIHAPGQLRHLNRLADRFPTAMYVFLLRNPLEILASEQRIKKLENISVLPRHYLNRVVPPVVPDCIGDIVHWMLNVRYNLRHKQEVRYSDLRQHPLWVEPEQRSTFLSRQTAPGRGNDGLQRGKVVAKEGE